MILTAHQPVYLPWLGLFHKIYLCDYFCVFDCVQYQKKDFNNRNKILTQNGPIWLTVPVESKNHFSKNISNIRIINRGWNKKHFKAISLAYNKSPYFENYIDSIEEILLKIEYEYLADLNRNFLDFFLAHLTIDRNIYLASDYKFEGNKSNLVLDMCKTLGATQYIFGSQGKNYADLDSFTCAGIEVHYQEYKHPVYSQIHSEVFVPNMSVLDLLFNEGPNSKDVLLRGNIHDLMNK